MARDVDLQALVTDFTTQLEGVISAQVHVAVVERIDQFKAHLFGTPAPAPKAPTQHRHYASKPCPVCGQANHVRRFSYLCQTHRTPENILRYKGSSRAAV
jgi:hypothetical protein